MSLAHVIKVLLYLLLFTFNVGTTIQSQLLYILASLDARFSIELATIYRISIKIYCNNIGVVLFCMNCWNLT